MKIVANRKNLHDNLTAVARFLRERGIDPMGVVKGVCGNCDIIELFLDAGFRRLGESRLSTLSAIRAVYGDRARLDLIRPPAMSEVAETVKSADGSFHCRMETVAAVVAECDAALRPHEITLIADVGHGREGFDQDRLPAAAKLVSNSGFARLSGISCYLCQHTPEDTLACQLSDLNGRLDVLSEWAGMRRLHLSVGSSLFFGAAVHHSELFDRITDFRIGTAALLGVSSSVGPQYIDFLSSDTFRLELEIMQVKGDRLILPIGLCDANPKDLLFSDQLTVDTVFSDHLVLKLVPGFAAHEGDVISCRLNYYSLNRLLMSPYAKFAME